MREQYESKSDLRKEQLVAAEFEARRGVKLRKMPISYRTDFLVIKGGKAVGVLEVKARGIASTDYPTIIVSLGKMMNGIRFHQLGLPYVIAFAMHDGIYYYAYDEDHSLGMMNIEYGGRTLNTRDQDDIEPVCHIKVEWLKMISPINVHEIIARESK
jgi:hypothetical protein